MPVDFFVPGCQQVTALLYHPILPCKPLYQSNIIQQVLVFEFVLKDYVRSGNRIIMEILSGYGSLWNFVGFHGFSWGSMELCGMVWSSVELSTKLHFWLP